MLHRFCNPCDHVIKMCLGTPVERQFFELKFKVLLHLLRTPIQQIESVA
ncbi:MAG: hypothetical protein ACRC12_01190 [Holosporales bacterium]